MTRTSKTDQKKAVNSVFSLVRSGQTVTEARKVIAKELNLTANTLWVWQNKLGMTTPELTRINNLVRPDHIISRTSRSNTKNVHNINNIKTGLGDVFHSLVTKDGRFSSKDASAISQVSSIILNTVRHELNVHKYASKMKKSDLNTIKNLLT